MLFKKITLPNGLRILLVPQPQSLAASVLILVEAGSEYEDKKNNGLSHFLEHMMFKGTANRPRPGQIAEELAGLGAQSNAFTGQEYTGYWAKAEARKLPDILDIVSDLYLNPVFDSAEIEKERGVVIEEINMYEDNPRRKVQEVFSALVYGDQPAGWSITGGKENVRKLTKNQFFAYRRERYVTPGTLVVVAGKFNEAAVMKKIRKEFGILKCRAAARKVRTEQGQKCPALAVHFKDSGQSHLVLGFRAFSLFDKRRYAIEVLSDILGGGMSSRLFKKVREELGAAYYVGSDVDLSLDHGLLEVAAGVEHGKTKVVIGVILEECRRLVREPVPAAEFKRSKDHMIGNVILGLETSDELASFYGGQEILAKKIVSPQELIKKVSAVTPEEVRSVAKAIFRNENLNFAAIGPYKNKSAFQDIIRM